mgnify:CR=1 FL=1
MHRLQRQAFSVLWLLAACQPAGAATLPEQMQCLRDNLPSAWVARMTVHAEDAEGGTLTQTLVYADRRDEARERVATVVQFLSPEHLRGLAHLYLQRGDRRRQFSYLPALDRTREVTGGDGGIPVLDGVPGLADLEALWRWPAQAAISLGPVTRQDGHAVQVIRANRRVANAQGVGFERFEGQLDLHTCLIISGTLRDADGQRLIGMTADRRSLQAFGPHWLARRIEIAPTRSGGRAVISLDAVNVDPVFPSGSFDPQRFHRVGLAPLAGGH